MTRVRTAAQGTRAVVNTRKVASGASADEEMTAEGSDGGDAACWAHLLCPDCGVVLDGSAHTPTCAVTPEMLLD